MNRPHFASVQDYGRRFNDAVLWQPYVQAVCKRHGLDLTGGIRSAVPGTHPVFLIGDRWVVKFFSDMFNGARSFAVEREIYGMLPWTAGFDPPGARLVGEGTLFPPEDGWEWPYLISTQMQGQSLHEVYNEVSFSDRLAISRSLGERMRQLHSVPLDRCRVLRPDWAPFRDWLSNQRATCVANHRRWMSLPDRLIDQLDDYILDVDALIDENEGPLLLHADLNADHLLGRLHNGRWSSTGIIDFGDARVGPLDYELVALHFGMFRCDTRLLRACLQAYGSDADLEAGFATRAMSFTLLHEFNVLAEIEVGGNQQPANVANLSELASKLWLPGATPS